MSRIYLDYKNRLVDVAGAQSDPSFCIAKFAVRRHGAFICQLLSLPFSPSSCLIYSFSIPATLSPDPISSPSCPPPHTPPSPPLDMTSGVLHVRRVSAACLLRSPHLPLLKDPMASTHQTPSAGPRFRPYASQKHQVTKGRYITSNDPRGYMSVVPALPSCSPLTPP